MVIVLFSYCYPKQFLKPSSFFFKKNLWVSANISFRWTVLLLFYLQSFGRVLTLAYDEDKSKEFLQPCKR